MNDLQATQGKTVRVAKELPERPIASEFRPACTCCQPTDSRGTDQEAAGAGFCRATTDLSGRIDLILQSFRWGAVKTGFRQAKSAFLMGIILIFASWRETLGVEQR